jgi:hypothetical protein
MLDNSSVDAPRGLLELEAQLQTLEVDPVQTGRAPESTRPANADLWPLRAMTIVSPGPATAIIATRTFIDEPLLENRVCLAPAASAKSSCAVDCTCHARSRVSTP